MKALNIFLAIAVSIAIGVLVMEGGLRLLGYSPPPTLGAFDPATNYDIHLLSGFLNASDNPTGSEGDWQRLEATLVSVVPIPAALPLLASALIGFGLVGYRKRKGQAA